MVTNQQLTRPDRWLQAMLSYGCRSLDHGVQTSDPTHPVFSSLCYSLLQTKLDLTPHQLALSPISFGFNTHLLVCQVHILHTKVLIALIL